MVSMRRIGCLIWTLFIFSLLGQVWSRRRCGRRTISPSTERNASRGGNAEQGEWPWMVALMKTNGRGVPQFHSTGYLIDKKHVLCAAHFFDGNETSLYSARIGHVNLTLAKVYSIASIVVPEDYRPGLFYHNIALLTLSEEVPDSDFHPVCLPPRNSLVDLAGKGTIVVGWTTPNGSDVSNPILKQSSAVTVVPNSMCLDAHGAQVHDLLPQGMTSAMLCGRYQNDNGGKSCPGDFGGPLLIREQTRWYAVGLVSFGGELCNTPELPGVYTRTSEYFNWIHEHTKLDSYTTPRTPQVSSTGAPTTVKPARKRDEGEGTRFGRTRHSRQEFTKGSAFINSLLEESVFRLEFKTNASRGVLFYADGVSLHRDYLGLFMRDGHITYVFNCGSGPAVMTTKSTYNDGQWHRVVFSRLFRQGRLIIVEEEDEVEGTTTGNDNQIIVKPTFFVGGLSQEAAEQSKAFLQGVDSSFPGCIRKVEAQGELWTAHEQSAAYDTIRCSTTMDPGSPSSEKAESNVSRNCGMTFGQPSRPKRMTGGQDANQGAWPWMVAIMLENSKGKKIPWCTGFLVDEKHFISAAQCFEETNATIYSAKIGHVNSNQGTEYPISAIAIHENFKKGGFYDDIALITLASAVSFPNFNPVCVPEQGSGRKGKRATFLSWGATRPDGPMSVTLKQLQRMPVLSNSVCNAAYGERFKEILPQGVTRGMLCAGFQDDGNKGICGGDAGGLLMISEEDRWFAVGFVSFGFMCGRAEYPGVYTRVSQYTTWINEHIG